MICPLREGEGNLCSWWLTGCLNPHVPTEVKRICGAGRRLEKREQGEIEINMAFINIRYRR